MLIAIVKFSYIDEHWKLVALMLRILGIKDVANGNGEQKGSTGAVINCNDKISGNDSVSSGSSENSQAFHLVFMSVSTTPCQYAVKGKILYNNY